MLRNTRLVEQRCHSFRYLLQTWKSESHAREGNRSMVKFCRGHGLKHEVYGKVIVATKRADLTLLERLCRRGLDHRLAVTRLAPEQMQEIEPRPVPRWTQSSVNGNRQLPGGFCEIR